MKKKPDYSTVNAEISRNWQRKKAELRGIDKAKKDIDSCIAQEDRNVAEKEKYQRTLDAKGREVEKQRGR